MSMEHGTMTNAYEIRRRRQRIAYVVIGTKVAAIAFLLWWYLS